MSCLLIAAPAKMLNELAKGTIKTWWGDQMKRENPGDGIDDLAERLEKEGITDVRVRQAFMVGAPLLAERLAIAQFKQKMPDFEIVAPEILSDQEALSIALMDMRPMSLSEAQQEQVLSLLRNDESMKVIH